jgi:hypothetical protein
MSAEGDAPIWPHFGHFRFALDSPHVDERLISPVWARNVTNSFGCRLPKVPPSTRASSCQEKTLAGAAVAPLGRWAASPVSGLKRPRSGLTQRQTLTQSGYRQPYLG